MKKIKFLIIFLLLAIGAFAQGTWTQRANFGGVARYAAAGFSIGNKGYIGCGSYNTGGWQYPNDFWEFDPATNAWSQIANFPGAGRRWSVGFSIGNKGYVGTGWTDSNAYTKDFWEYNASTNIWIQKADFAGEARHAAIGFSIGTKGYIGAGYGPPYLQDFWEYESSSDSWTQKTNWGGFGSYYPAAFSIGTKGYIGTGNSIGNIKVKDFWEWDQSTDTWTQKADFGGTAREGAVGFSIGYKGYIGVGQSANNEQDFWEYDLIGNIWTQVTNYGGSATNFATGFSIGTKGYVGTGWAASVTQDFWEFDPQDTSFNLLSGSVFSDTNANCLMDGGENPLTNWFVVAQDSSTSLNIYGSTDANGNYQMWVPTGNYTVSLIPNPYWNQVCPLSPPEYNVSVAGTDTVNNLNFGAQISQYCSDLAVSIGTFALRRCMTNNFYVQYWNNGTVPATNVLLEIQFDNPLGRIIPLSSTLPWDSVSGTSYFWHIDTVQVGQYVSFTLLDSVSCNTQLGDSILVNAYISSPDNDCEIQNNDDDDFHIVIGSFDPNEKLVSTTSNTISSKQGLILSTDTINYTIHFQNTGSDTAFKVVVYDTLDSPLNVSSVISGTSSHPYTFELIGIGILKWTFNNILLPDSNINEVASHGFVKFQILQKINNSNGIVIKNSAAIVFDFNTAVITDTVVLTINNLLFVQHRKLRDEESIRIYPNPSNGAVTLQYELPKGEQYGEIILYNTQGAEVKKYKVDGTFKDIILDNTMLPAGTYFYRLQTGKGSVGVKKMIVVK